MNTNKPNIAEIIHDELLSHQATIEQIIAVSQEPLVRAAQLMVQTLQNGRKILLCGNGGSAADAQHIAAELTGRYKTERRGIGISSQRPQNFGLSQPPEANKAMRRQNGFARRHGFCRPSLSL